MTKTIREIENMKEEFYAMKDIHEREGNFTEENPLKYICFLIIGIFFIAFGVLNLIAGIIYLGRHSNVVMNYTDRKSVV